MPRIFRYQLLALITLAILFSLYAFASKDAGILVAGEGASPISGWVVSDIQYTVAEGSNQIAAVAFDLNAPAGQASVSLNMASGRSFPCSNPVATHWTCPIHSQVSVAEIDQFQVTALGK